MCVANLLVLYDHLPFMSLPGFISVNRFMIFEQLWDLRFA